MSKPPAGELADRALRPRRADLRPETGTRRHGTSRSAACRTVGSWFNSPLGHQIASPTCGFSIDQLQMPWSAQWGSSPSGTHSLSPPEAPGPTTITKPAHVSGAASDQADRRRGIVDAEPAPATATAAAGWSRSEPTPVDDGRLRPLETAYRRAVTRRYGTSSSPPRNRQQVRPHRHLGQRLLPGHAGGHRPRAAHPIRRHDGWSSARPSGDGTPSEFRVDQIPRMSTLPRSRRLRVVMNASAPGSDGGHPPTSIEPVRRLRTCAEIAMATTTAAPLNTSVTQGLSPTRMSPLIVVAMKISASNVPPTL